MNKELFTDTMNQFFKDWLELVLQEAFPSEDLADATGENDFADSPSFELDDINVDDPSFSYGKQLGLPKSVYVKKNPLSGSLLPQAGNDNPMSYTININLGGYGGS